MLDFRIATFLKLCETKSYTKTAKLLDITQPSVTQHIKHLQNKYQCKLFTYEGKLLQLTPEGEYLRRQAESMTRMSNKVFDELQRMGKQQELRFGFPTELGETAAASILAEISGQNHVSVQITTGNSAGLLRLLEDSRLDCVVTDKLFQNSQFGSTPLARVRFGGYAGAALTENTITVKRLLEECLLLREDGSADRAVLERLLQKRDLSFNDFSRTQTSNALSALQALAAADQGIFFTYASTVSADGPAPLSKLQEFTDERPLVFLYQKDAQERVKDFIEQFRDKWNEAASAE